MLTGCDLWQFCVATIGSVIVHRLPVNQRLAVIRTAVSVCLHAELSSVIVDIGHKSTSRR